MKHEPVDVKHPAWWHYALAVILLTVLIAVAANYLLGNVERPNFIEAPSRQG